MSDRIDHAAEARMHIDWAHEQQEVEGQVSESVQNNATLAVAEAVLALVEQQRIANLLALWSMPNESKPGFIEAAGLTGDQDVQAARMIREGLGL
ncbi:MULTISPECIES: hypothetical protein [Bacteria]|uniref:hypothetical protein n=1 Tax=Bacteria TaxID=2 RepID=UPI003C7EC52D